MPAILRHSDDARPRETRDTLTVAEVTFALRRSARRRTIGITIPREGPPVVALPARCSRRAAEAAVRGKLAWVRRKLGERSALAQLPPHRYEAGERFPYLGREHELVLIDDLPAAAGGRRRTAARSRRGCRRSACIRRLHDSRRSRGRSLACLTRHGRRRRLGRLRQRSAASATTAASSWPARRRPTARPFRAWYRRRAVDVLAARVAHFAPLVGVAPPPIAVKDMRSRWGSCSAKGRVSLHWGLVLLEPALLDYVVVHELVHLLELNHRPAFWRGVERLVPDYLERRKRLRSEGARSVI